MTKSYSELITLPTFIERFRYLQLRGAVGEATFGSRRYLNQLLYTCPEWRACRDDVIIRDQGADLACYPDRIIFDRIYIHHIIPITADDIVRRDPKVFDLENLIATTHITHEAIHYGDESLLVLEPIVRAPNDTCPWR